MVRAALAAVLLILTGCRLPPERESLRPLPEHLTFGYDDLTSRARHQAGAAVEAFYIDSWQDLADAAAGLEQTARFLGKSVDVPAAHKDTVAKEAETLRLDAVNLGDAARTKAVDRSNELLQRINLTVRRLRPREVVREAEPMPPADTPELPPSPQRLRGPDRPPVVTVDTMPTQAPAGRGAIPEPKFPKGK